MKPKDPFKDPEKKILAKNPASKNLNKKQREQPKKNIYTNQSPQNNPNQGSQSRIPIKKTIRTYRLWHLQATAKTWGKRSWQPSTQKILQSAKKNPESKRAVGPELKRSQVDINRHLLHLTMCRTDATGVPQQFSWPRDPPTTNKSAPPRVTRCALRRPRSSLKSSKYPITIIATSLPVSLIISLPRAQLICILD